MDEGQFKLLRSFIEPLNKKVHVNRERLELKLFYEKDFASVTTFVAEDVSLFIRNAITDTYSTSLSNIGKSSFTVFHFEPITSEESLQLHAELHQIFLYISNLSKYVCSDYAKNYLNDGLQIRLYLVDIPKQFTKDEVFTPNNTNSGFTDNHSIVIYRREELYKVLIHELLHNVPLAPEELNAEPSLIKNALSCYKFISYESESIEEMKREQIYIREAYVETITSFLICTYYSSDYLDFTNKFNKLKEYTRHKSLYLLKIKNCLNMNEDCKWKEKTNTFGYFVVKDEILHNFTFDIKKLALSWEDISVLVQNVCKSKQYTSVEPKSNSLKMTIF